jgi:hypothetical protein
VPFLHIAVMYNRSRTIPWLVEAGCHVAEVYEGQTALSLAVTAEKFEEAVLLAELGADMFQAACPAKATITPYRVAQTNLTPSDSLHRYVIVTALLGVSSSQWHDVLTVKL